MKKLITLLAIVLTVQCTGQMASFESLEDRPKQEIYYKIYVHESNVGKIGGGLSVDGDWLMWDEQEDRFIMLSDFEKYDNWCNELVPDTLNFVKRGAMYLSTSSSAILPHDTEFDNIITVNDSVFGNFIFHQWYIKKRRCEPSFKGFYDWIKDN